jgi:Xaa-Pro aminopeptidase
MRNVELRKEKTQEAMKREGIDLLIVYSSNNNRISGPRYLYYLTGFIPLGPHNLLFLQVDGKSELFVSSNADAMRAKNEAYVDEVKVLNNVEDVVITYIKQCQAVPERLALAGSEDMEPVLLESLQAKLGYRFKDGKTLFFPIDPSEIEAAKVCAEIADAVFETALQYSRPGITEYELVAELEYTARIKGCDDNFTLISSAKHNMQLHWATDRRLQKGDIVLFEITPVYRGVATQLCRSLVLGRPSEILQEKYQILQKALVESLAIIKPGVLASEIVRIQNRVISEAGYAQYCKPPYMRARGHGLNIAYNPIGISLSEDSKIPLQEGLILVLHPNQYIPEVGYLALGDTIVVTESGYEDLNARRFPGRLYVKGDD